MKKLLKQIRNLERTIKKREVYLKNTAKFMNNILYMQNKKFKFDSPIAYDIKLSLDTAYNSIRSHYAYIEKTIELDKDAITLLLLKSENEDG